jgi:hypothetical protein
MPGFVARAGLAEKILPLEMMAGEVSRRISVSGVRTRRSIEPALAGGR